MMRRLVAGTGWKMNHGCAETRDYARRLRAALEGRNHAALDVFVLPPFTALHAAQEAFGGTGVRHGAQNMHWEARGAWTGEISAPMLAELGCSLVALGHSERLRHFGETYALVGRKLDAALRAGLTPVVCLGETAEQKAAGEADAALGEQLRLALAGQDARAVPQAILAYEPRWAIGGDAAATPGYVAERHAGLRARLARDFGAEAARATRIIYGGAVTPVIGPALMGLSEVDGLFVGRAAWSAEGFAQIIAIVAQAASDREESLT